MEKLKQRAVYFSDEEWQQVKEAAKLSDQRNVTHFVSVSVMKAVKREVKKNELQSNETSNNS